MFIAYHCTDIKSAESIINEGFRKGTFFAHLLEDALMMGRGNHVFAVAFPTEALIRPGALDTDLWQFINKKNIKTDLIVSHTIYNRDIRYYNKKLYDFCVEGIDNIKITRLEQPTLF